jgi:hypothetical protein
MMDKKDANAFYSIIRTIANSLIKIQPAKVMKKARSADWQTGLKVLRNKILRFTVSYKL